MKKDCVQYVPLIGAREGELAAEERAALDRHLAGCAACRAREADARALGPLIRDALMTEANQRDFAPFVDAVMARVEAKGSVLPERPSTSARLRRAYARDEREIGGGAKSRGGVLDWILAHRKLAFGTLAPALAAAALLVYVQTRPASPEVALMELTSEGEATMILQTQDGPLVLLEEERS